MAHRNRGTSRRNKNGGFCLGLVVTLSLIGTISLSIYGWLLMPCSTFDTVSTFDAVAYELGQDDTHEKTGSTTT